MSGFYPTQMTPEQAEAINPARERTPSKPRTGWDWPKIGAWVGLLVAVVLFWAIVALVAKAVVS